MLTQLTELKLNVEGLEKERDFYFGKLRDIEVLCQEVGADSDAPSLISRILEVLYATEVNLQSLWLYRSLSSI